MEVTKAEVQAVMMERGDDTTRHRSEETGVRSKLGGPLPTSNFTKAAKNISKTYNVDQTEICLFLKKLAGQTSSGRA